jgi:hypothetical protein
MPDELVVPAGSTTTVESGETKRATSLDIDGTLDVDGTLQVGQWRLDGQPLPAVSEWSATPQTVSVSFETEGETLDRWREYDRAGDVSVENGYGGSYRTLDRGGRADPVVLQPPPWFAPPLTRVTGYINSYSEEPQGPARTQISLTVQRLSNRKETTTNVDESKGDWQLRTVNGTLALDADQVAPSPASGTTTGRQSTMTITVGAEQAATLANALAYPAGVTEREIKNGQNIVVDESPDERQTVLIASPRQAELRSGEYPVTSWSIEPAGFDDRRRFRIELELAKRTVDVLVVQSGRTYTVPAGTTETYDRADIDGELSVQGTLILTGDY